MMSHSERFYWLAGVFAIAALALFLRLHQLGDTSLDFDEYLHVFAAKSMIATGRPTLPSGNEYGRALSYTRLVAQSIRLFGSSEAAARLPSVVFGMLLVVLAGAVAGSWWGAGAALVVAALLTMDPYCLQMSRVCRMYASFHFFYLAAFYACYQALEGLGGWRRILWGAIAAASALTAFRLQPLAADLAAGVAAFIALQAVRTRQPKYLWLVGLGAVVGLVSAAGQLAKLWHEVNSAPAYANPWRYDHLFYLRQWWHADRWMVLLTVPAFFWWVRRQPSRGWYMACNVAVPFALHSFIFDWKEARYLLQIVPLMLIVVGCALFDSLKELAGWIAGKKAFRARPIAWALTALALAPFVLTGLARRQLSGLNGDVARWREAYQTLRPFIKTDDQLVITVPLTSAYYINRLPDYLMLNALVSDSGHQTQRGADGFFHDWYTGRALITNAREMQRVFDTHASGWVVADIERFPYETCVPKEVRDLIERHCTRVASPDPSVIVYTWGKDRGGS